MRWCSDNCRKHGLSDVDRQLMPSARAVGADDWSEVMEPARMVARRLVATRRAEIA